nr:PilZ domain-containing protein [uncultured Desulfobulbus sp.]
MSADSRRSPRLSDYLPLEVLVVHMEDNIFVAGPFAGRIIDISQHGACLLMSQVMQNSFHVFHSTRENDHTILELRISLQPDLEQFLLNARPIWFDLFGQGEIRAFKMGVEFTEHTDKAGMRELQKAIRINQPHRASWWQLHCRPQQRR